MIARKMLRSILRVVVAQGDAHPQHHLVRAAVQNARDPGPLDVKTVLIEPPLRRVRRTDIERDGQAFGRVLAVHVIALCKHCGQPV